jgi:hypothetical protein
VSVRDLLTRVTQVLTAARIDYMLTGSYASSLHGTPRATQDLDLVIAPTGSQLKALLSLLPDTDYYVSPEAAFDALARRSQFNIIDFSTGWKIDFIIVKDRDFSRTEFQRRRLQELDGLALFVASAEDVLLAKLEWAKLGSSARQIEDAAGIIRLQGAQLDTEYVQRWVKVLGVEEQWTLARERAV